MKSSRLLSHSGQKAAEIPPDLFAMGQEADVTTADFSKNLLTTIPADRWVSGPPSALETEAWVIQLRYWRGDE